ncbi:N-acetylneuraminate synthase family protein [Chryseobacterium populi]|uniref:Sialic acid synthase n=1 Tax=Chryseobacterium populi TaxID=1144316 RepID=J3CN83_9FLAO|nr:N-acetylneuraminate synthase family protein [Chryseobacterium populi]EJL74901.1 sialic acid synthase [Chryseobacterium populi]
MNNINKPYYIAETAFHHEGNINFLENLIDDIAKLDIDAIKFHLLLDLEDYIVENHPAKEVLKKISLDQENWLNIFERVKTLGKEIVLLCNDLKSLKFANQIQDSFPIIGIELHSTGLNDLFLLEESIQFKKTIILGVGGSTFDEVQYAVDFLKSNNKNDILLIHGFQNYPTNYKDINFKRINLLSSAFGLPIGYADHTDPNDNKNKIISTLPILYGVNVIEKHITNVFGEKRIDAQAAIDLKTMEEVIELGNAIYKSIGENSIIFSEAELNYGNTGPMKKALVARREIKKGEILKKEDIAFKRTEESSPLSQKDFNKVVNAIALTDLKKDQILSFSNLEYKFQKPSFEQFFVK